MRRHTNRIHWILTDLYMIGISISNMDSSYDHPIWLTPKKLLSTWKKGSSDHSRAYKNYCVSDGTNDLIFIEKNKEYQRLTPFQRATNQEGVYKFIIRNKRDGIKFFILLE